MQADETMNEAILSLLREELVPSTGCTEPTSLAFAAALGTDVLAERPQKMLLEVSESIYKNSKSVFVPNTAGMKGIEPALAAGAIAGDHKQGLNVLANVSDDDIEDIKRYVREERITIRLLKTDHLIDYRLTLKGNESKVVVRVQDAHTNLVYLEKDGEVLLDEVNDAVNKQDELKLNTDLIWTFVESVDVADLKAILDEQIAKNMAIAEVGIKEPYGSSIGRLVNQGETAIDHAIAYAAAACDARMSGCNMPVIINGGSGNQGITSSIPLIVYAKEKGYTKEAIYKPLALSNLFSLYQKQVIGRLSAFCGVVCAGASVAAGIAYLETQDYSIVVHTIVNTLGILSGMICDGAKPSCAAKIAMGVRAGFLGYDMSRHNKQFDRGDGIISENIEATIQNIGHLAREGMAETNRCILDMMLE